MAVTNPAVDAPSRPRWPSDPFDPDRARVSYDVVADELVIHFGGVAVPAVSELIDAPDVDDAAVLVGLGPNGEDTGEVVGIHVYPLLVGAVQARPRWARIAWAAMAGEIGEEMLRAELPDLVGEIAELFDRYWTLAPVE